MIAKDSTSYPYLSIAQHYKVSYAEVLRVADVYDKFWLKPPYTEWMLKVWFLERDKRKQ